MCSVSFIDGHIDEPMDNESVVDWDYGKWIVAEECKTLTPDGKCFISPKTYICPICTYHFSEDTNYCPNCGEKMKEGNRE